jgi:hypothetical protein
VQILLNFGRCATENVSTKLSGAYGTTEDLDSLLLPRDEIAIQHEKQLSMIESSWRLGEDQHFLGPLKENITPLMSVHLRFNWIKLKVDINIVKPEHCSSEGILSLQPLIVDLKT